MTGERTIEQIVLGNDPPRCMDCKWALDSLVAKACCCNFMTIEEDDWNGYLKLNDNHNEIIAIARILKAGKK